MLAKRLFSFLSILCCLCSLGLPVLAAEVDCDAEYCFSSGDFSEEELEGICITALPESSVGSVMLGARILRPGDILTVDQLGQMTFTPMRRETDTEAVISYLPIFRDHVAPADVMTLSIRGKEDKAPAAEDSAGETYKNLPLEGTLSVKDPEGQALVYTVTRKPKRGEVVVNADGSFTYTPKKNKVGVDSFTFTAADPAGNVSREATFTITILKPTDAPQYTDTLGKSCRFAAEWMKNTGIFVGESLDGNACFGPERQVSRGQFVTMLVKALDIPVEEHATFTGYTDELPDWLKPYLAAAVRSGLTAGLPASETFRPEEVITGAEAAVMLSNALDLAVPEEAVMAEEPADDHWAASALHILESHGISLTGEPLTREQAAQVLYRATQLAEDAAGALVLRAAQ